VTHAAPPANVTNANASATAAPRIPTVNTTAAANASAAADDTQYPRLRSFRQQAVRQLAIVLATFDDKKSVEQLDPFEYLGAIFVVALGVGGTAWTIFAIVSTTSDLAPVEPDLGLKSVCLEAQTRYS
jgi:hypothetical protein